MAHSTEQTHVSTGVRALHFERHNFNSGSYHRWPGHLSNKFINADDNNFTDINNQGNMALTVGTEVYFKENMFNTVAFSRPTANASATQ